jgi:Protein of unknown function (DUF2914)
MKDVLIGVLLTTLGATMAISQVDTTGTRRPSYPDSMAYPTDSTSSIDQSSNAVTRAVISTGIMNHEPTDSLSQVPSTTSKVFFFTQIKGMEGKTITHRWMKDGSKVADIKISIGSKNFRCHSSRVVSGKTGYWTAQVLDSDGKKLKEVAFTVGNASGETPLGMR